MNKIYYTEAYDAPYEDFEDSLVEISLDEVVNYLTGFHILSGKVVIDNEYYVQILLQEEYDEYGDVKTPAVYIHELDYKRIII